MLPLSLASYITVPLTCSVLLGMDCDALACVLGKKLFEPEYWIDCPVHPSVRPPPILS